MISRRKFLGLTALAIPAAFGVDARLIEPRHLRVSKLTAGTGKTRFIHITDFHHKGDTDYAGEVIQTINDLKPDFVCFTGDLIEDKRFLPEALSFIEKINVPVYGVPGNHDHWCGAGFDEYDRGFAKTGGAFLTSRNLALPQYHLELIAMPYSALYPARAPEAPRRILLTHYPATADSLGPERVFDLILAGHSHGGQIRFPFVGALALPTGVGRYDMGYYETPSGPLYVNVGLGTYRIPCRFNCRPEITVVTI